MNSSFFLELFKFAANAPMRWSLGLKVQENFWEGRVLLRSDLVRLAFTGCILFVSSVSCAQLGGSGVQQAPGEGQIHPDCRESPEEGGTRAVKVFPEIVGAEASYVDSTTRLGFVLNAKNDRRKELLEAIAEVVDAESKHGSSSVLAQQKSVFRVPAGRMQNGALYAVMSPVDSRDRIAGARGVLEGCAGSCDLPVAAAESTSGFAVFVKDKNLSIFPFDDAAYGSRQLRAEFRQVDEAFLDLLRNSSDQTRRDLARDIVKAVRAAQVNPSNGSGGSLADNTGGAPESREDAEPTFNSLSPAALPAYYLIWEVNASTAEKTRAVGIVLKAPRLADTELVRWVADRTQQMRGSASAGGSQACLNVSRGYYPEILLFPHLVSEISADVSAGD